jgi:hypothetical protein
MVDYLELVVKNYKKNWGSFNIGRLFISDWITKFILIIILSTQKKYKVIYCIVIYRVKVRFLIVSCKI